MSFAGIESGVGRYAFDCQGVIAYAFARGFDGTSKSGGRLEDEDCGGFSGEIFGDFAGGIAADFFVGDEEDGDGARQLSVPGLQSFDGEEHQGKAGFHVENAGALQAAIFYAAGHGGERSQRIDRVEVAEEEDGLGVCGAGEIDLEVVAEFFGAMEMGTSAKQREFLGEMSAHTI